jgi:hypothetical protein
MKIHDKIDEIKSIIRFAQEEQIKCRHGHSSHDIMAGYIKGMEDALKILQDCERQ